MKTPRGHDVTIAPSSLGGGAAVEIICSICGGKYTRLLSVEDVGSSLRTLIKKYRTQLDTQPCKHRKLQRTYLVVEDDPIGKTTKVHSSRLETLQEAQANIELFKKQYGMTRLRIVRISPTYISNSRS